MPKSLGMLEPGHRDDDDRGRTLHARLRFLRGEHGEAVSRSRKMSRQRVAEAVRRMGLKHVVITAVARDDLKDGGADHFARTINAVREMDPSIIIEVLVPDFHAQDWCIELVLEAAPDIFNHNMETVERLTPVVRSRAKYRTSLEVLRKAKERLAEGGDEERRDARAGRAGTGVVPNDGRPARDRLPGADARPISPADAESSARDRVRHARSSSMLTGRSRAAKGFDHVASGPLVRSSYHAADFHPVVR